LHGDRRRRRVSHLVHLRRALGPRRPRARSARHPALVPARDRAQLRAAAARVLRRRGLRGRGGERAQAGADRRMTTAAALILYPSWAIAVLFAATAVRLGRSTPRGLIVLCVLLAVWVTALVLVELPGTIAIAERIVPFGMLQAGAYVLAGANVV